MTDEARKPRDFWIDPNTLTLLVNSNLERWIAWNTPVEEGTIHVREVLPVSDKESHMPEQTAAGDREAEIARVALEAYPEEQQIEENVKLAAAFREIWKDGARWADANPADASRPASQEKK